MRALTHQAWVEVAVFSEEVTEVGFAEVMVEEVVERHAQHAINAEDRTISLAIVKPKQPNATPAENWGISLASANPRTEDH